MSRMRVSGRSVTSRRILTTNGRNTPPGVRGVGPVSCPRWVRVASVSGPSRLLERAESPPRKGESPPREKGKKKGEWELLGSAHSTRRGRKLEELALKGWKCYCAWWHDTNSCCPLIKACVRCVSPLGARC